MKGLADSQVDAAAWAERKPDGKALRMTALHRALSHADGDARAAALMATLEEDAKGAPWLFTHAICGSCSPRPLTQLHQVADVSIAHCMAWCSIAHGTRVLHQCTTEPRQRSLRRSKRRRCVCLRQTNGIRGHPILHLRRVVAQCGGSP